MPDDSFVVEDMASGYDRDADGSFRGHRLALGVSGDGAIVSTALDMTRWLDNFRTNRLELRQYPERLVAPARLADGRVLPYGLGIGIREHRGLTAYHHGGGAAGYRSYMLWYPDETLGIMVLANRTDGDVMSRALGVADVWLDRRRRAPRRATAERVRLSNAVLESLAGTYVDLETGFTVRASRTSRPDADLALSGVGWTMRAVSDTEFEAGNFHYVSRARFERSSEGPSALHVDIGHGAVTRLIRVDPARLTEGDRHAYVGSYGTDELPTTIEVQLRDGRLYVQLGHGEWPAEQTIELTPIIADIFTGQGIHIRFRRNGKGHVVGMMASMSRARFVELRREQRVSVPPA
jgi:hypothetical protein